MSVETILEAIDKQILQLQQARSVLAGDNPNLHTVGDAEKQAGKRRGRPKGSTNKKPETTAVVTSKKAGRRPMSAYGKARIAAAQKARWAAQKKKTQPAKEIAAKTSKKTILNTGTVTKKAAPIKRSPSVKSAAASPAQA